MGLSVADDGRLVFTANTPEHPREVYALSRRNLELERLTDSNPWLGDVRLARQEVVTYKAADGLDIQGLLIWPLDYEEGQRYPLILAVHGGPEAHYSNGWLTSYNLPAQHAAAEGYFMFYQNYRGSTGRGVEFTFTSQGRPAMEEFSDLVDGVDHLIERGLVDGDRVGITGGSYGGYASAWGATYFSERFAAAVMNVGIGDKISMLGTSDIPQELYLVHYRTWPWENWELYTQASPIFFAHRARTPILILHGDADPRVDPTQSKILYRYLTLQENPPPLRLVLYRGEGHGNQRAATRWDYSLRLMQWMDHYLKGEGGEPPAYQLDYGFGNGSSEESGDDD
jgi:dipeptidyl aminopeptidase/acylaminoacyl peptidase